MAMSNCKECGKAVSTKAKTCPNCGVPKPASKKELEEKKLKQMKKEQWTGYLELKRREKEMSDYEKSKQAVDEYYSKSSSKSPKKTSSSTQTTSGERENEGDLFVKDTVSKFLDGELDLATSFWGFLFVGTIIIGFVCGFLSAAYGKGWYIPLIGYTIFAIQGTWQSAEKYKIEQNKKKQSEVWGFLAQVVCVMNGISIIGMIAEFF